MTLNWPMFKMYSHHSGDVMFTFRTLLMTTDTQICADVVSGSSNLTEFSYCGRHRSRALRPHAITLPVTVLQHNKPHIHLLVVVLMTGSADMQRQVLQKIRSSCRFEIHLWCHRFNTAMLTFRSDSHFWHDLYCTLFRNCAMWEDWRSKPAKRHLRD